MRVLRRAKQHHPLGPRVEGTPSKLHCVLDAPNAILACNLAEPAQTCVVGDSMNTSMRSQVLAGESTRR
eukprot:3661234-Amphidinium_carterae.2